MTYKHVPRVGRLAEQALIDARPPVPMKPPILTATNNTVFSYEALAPEIADIARKAAADIRRCQKQSIADIGNALFRVKAALDHGAFGKWLDAEFAMGARTAENYMAAAKFLEGKSEKISYLPPSALYALAAPSADSAIVEEVLVQLEAGTVIPAQVIRERLESAARERRTAEVEVRKDLEKIKKERETQKRRLASRAAQDRKLREEREADEARRQANAKAIAALLAEKLTHEELNILDQKMRGTYWPLVADALARQKIAVGWNR